MGLGATLSGVIVSVGAITAFIYRIFGGSLTDRLGRKKLAVIGSAIFACMSLACGFASSVTSMVIFRILQMIGYAMASTAISVMVVDVTPRDKMSEGIGYFGLGGSLSQAVTPTIALALFATVWHFKSVMLFGFGLGLIGMIFALFCNYETNPAFPGNRLQINHKNETKNRKLTFTEVVWTLIEKKAVPAAVIALFSTIASSSVFMFLTLYAAKNGIANAGLFFMLSAIATVVARLSLSKLADKYGVLSCVVPGYFMIIAAFVLLLVGKGTLFTFYVSGALFGLGQGTSAPALNAAAVKAASPERRSAASSTFMLPMDIGFMLGSVIWGAVIDLVSFDAVFISSAFSLVIALVFAFVFFGNKERKSTSKLG